ncbi:GNAT family N-acetyltransferase [Altererythrobacter xixiisoli]|uniref:GNAT family N-acetyltransferase n=2 Tax=Croceibacterium xixiisoli TaxID=1476466 RepID=A0A6I4TUT3_9SPHN|nr:GNAT family N-acetyltransferase [Croceibacterium xixiisoli]
MLETGIDRPLFAMAQDGDQAVALPLADHSRRLTPLSNWYAFTWAPMATAGDQSPALLGSLAKDLARRTPAMVLDKLPDEDGTASRLETAFRKAGWLVQREICDTNHVLPVGGRSYAQFLADRPGALRTTLKRKAKKVDVELFTRFNAEAWDEYEAVYRESWKPEEGDPALLRRFAMAEGGAGRIRFGLARHDGVVIAAQFWTVEGGTAYIHKLAHRESAKPLSAGTTLTAALFAEVIDNDGVELVDFGTGNDPYKRDWMETIRPRYRLTMWRRENPRNWPVIARSWLRQLVSRRRDV